MNESTYTALKNEAAKNWSFNDIDDPARTKANRSTATFAVWFAKQAIDYNIVGSEADELREKIAKDLFKNRKRKKASYQNMGDPAELTLREGDQRIINRMFRYMQPSKGSDLKLVVIVKGKKVAMLAESIKDVVKKLQAAEVIAKTGERMSAWKMATLLYKQMRQKASEDLKADYLTGATLEESSGQEYLKFMTEDQYLETILHRIFTEDKYNIKRIPSLSEDPNVYSFHHTDHTRIYEGETPNYDQWLHVFNRGGDKVDKDSVDTFQAWIWSVCDPTNRSRQALWLFDPDGFTGKSVFIDAFSQFWNDGSTNNFTSSLRHNSGSKDFDASSLWGSRLITAADCRSAHILRTELLHRILGGDDMPIEAKGVTAFTGKIDAKVLIASNLKPEVNMEFINEASRVIVLKLTHPPEKYMRNYCKPDPDHPEKILRRSNGQPILVGSDLKEKLYREMPHILHKCRESYELLCPSGNMIEFPDSIYEQQLNMLCDDEAEVFMRIISQYEVTEADEDVVLRTDLMEHFEAELKEVSSIKLNNYTKMSFYRLFEQILRVRLRRPTGKSVEGRQRGYYGVRRKRKVKAARTFGTTNIKEAAEQISEGV